MKNPIQQDRDSGRRALRRAQRVFLVIGMLALGYTGYVLADTQVFQAYENWRLGHAAKVDLRSVPAGYVIGRLEIPRIGVNAVVVQGDSERILRRAVGHIPGTALPGQSGNIVFAGHRDTFFGPLRRIRRGDRIVLETPGVAYEYEVESTFIVVPNDLSVLQDSRQGQLTLVTCYPFRWIGSAPDRFVIRAWPIKQPPGAGGQARHTATVTN